MNVKQIGHSRTKSITGSSVISEHPKIIEEVNNQLTENIECGVETYRENMKISKERKLRITMQQIRDKLIMNETILDNINNKITRMETKQNLLNTDISNFSNNINETKYLNKSWTKNISFCGCCFGTVIVVALSICFSFVWLTIASSML